MYSLVKIKDSINTFYIKVGDFYIAKLYYIPEDESWCSEVENLDGVVRERYCNTNKGKTVEGLLRQLIFRAYNEIIEE